MNKTFYLLLPVFFFVLFSCGTIYIPQILPEARGVGKSIGQENIAVTIIPITSETITSANKHPYIRRVIEASDLTQPAELISVEDAIAEKLPPPTISEPYKLGIGDELLIAQSELLFTQIFAEEEEEETPQTTARISSRTLKIADDGFVSMFGIGRLQLEGLTQFEAEDLIYQTLVQNEKNTEFELRISAFKSKKLYISGYEGEVSVNASSVEGGLSGSTFIMVPFTNTNIYLHQLMVALQPKRTRGQDSLILLKRGKNIYRMSLARVLAGEIEDIRMVAEDRVFIERLPYRPETAILIGEVRQEKLVPISADFRQSLAEALYSGGAMVTASSDPSQIFIIRELKEQNFVAYHLDSSNPSRLTLATKFELRPNDIIYVAPQFVTNYNRALSQLLITASTTTAITN